MDTTTAIVGGIVALSAGPDSIPPEWVAARWELDWDEPAVDRGGGRVLSGGFPTQ